MAQEPAASWRIAVVGPCSAGKSTLVQALKEAGYEARHVAQEHSYVPAMWQRITKPDLLVFLDVDYTQSRARRPHIDRGVRGLAQQHERLAHAHAHCDLYVDTSGLTPTAVRERVFAFLAEHAPLL